MPIGVLRVVEDLGFPGQPARGCVEREDKVVGTSVDDESAVNRQVPVHIGEATDMFVEVIRELPAVFPGEITG